ncbi:MAG: DUF5647 family protein, partial [Chloroflexota bacterium]
SLLFRASSPRPTRFLKPRRSARRREEREIEFTVNAFLSTAIRKVDEMTKTQMAKRNLEYLQLFTQEILENESLARRVPKGASIYFIPDGDPELAAANRKLAQRARKQGKKVVLVRIELAPKTMYVPRLIVQRVIPV